MGGAPTSIAGFHHVAVTVPDVTEAADFLVAHLDCELLFRTPPGGSLTEGYARALRVAAGARILGIALLRSREAVIELFQYEAPSQNRAFPANSDVGGHHLAFRVDDLEGAVARLEAAGAKAAAPVSTARAPEFRGMRWVYVQAPFGLQLELVHFPQGSF